MTIGLRVEVGVERDLAGHPLVVERGQIRSCNPLIL
jgi:hypothetical protein